MTFDDLVLDAVRYRRHVGATLEDIRDLLLRRDDEPHGPVDDRQALDRLEARGLIVRAGSRWFLTPALQKQTKGRAYPLPEWRQEDSWILLALLYNARRGRPTPLAELIATADFINHAIPTTDELHGALNRLATAHLVRSTARGFGTTERAAALMAKVEAACTRKVLDQWDCLRRLLECPCCGIALKTVRWRITVSDADVKEAYERYTKGGGGELRG